MSVDKMGGQINLLVITRVLCVVEEWVVGERDQAKQKTQACSGEAQAQSKHDCGRDYIYVSSHLGFLGSPLVRLSLEEGGGSAGAGACRRRVRFTTTLYCRCTTSSMECKCGIIMQGLHDSHKLAADDNYVGHPVGIDILTATLN